MAFNIDDVLGPAPAPAGAAPGGFNIDDVLGSPAAPAGAGPPQLPELASTDDEPGVLEAGVRGLTQGVTFGFRDEIGAALESAFTDKTYTQARNEARAADKAAREAHPWVYGGGELAGGLATSLVPGGAIVKGGGAAAHLIRGAGAGIVQGIGESEAEDLGGIVQDAAKSGLQGAALGGLLGVAGEKLTKGAPRRVDEQLIQDITGGRATSAGKKIYANEDLVTDVAKKFELQKVARDPEALSAATTAAKKQVGEQIGQVYQEADRVFLGVKSKDVLGALDSVKRRYNSPGDKALRTQIESLQDEVRDLWGAGARDRVPLAKVNEMVTRHENVGFASASLTPAAGSVLKRDVAKAVDGVLKDRMREIGQFAEHVKAAPTAMNSAPLAESVDAADLLKKLGGLNKDYRGLKLIGKMSGEVSALPPANRAAGGLRNAIGKGVEGGALAASIATANPLPYLAAKVGKPLLAAGARAGDELLAKITQAAAGGKTTARLVQQAIEAGIPRGAIAAALGPQSQPGAQ